MAEVRQVFGHVSLDRAEVLEHRAFGGVPLAEHVQQRRDGSECGLALERRQPLDPVTLDLVQARQLDLEAALQLAGTTLDRLALVERQRVDLLRRERMARDDRDEREAARGELQREPRDRAPSPRTPCAAPPPARRCPRRSRCAAAGTPRGRTRGGSRDASRHERLEVTSEATAQPRRHRQRHRVIGLREVVHVHPVARRRAFRGGSPDVVEHGGEATRTGDARGEDVETRRADLEAELEGIDRARLADRPFERRDLRCRLETELRRIEPAAEALRGQREPVCDRHWRR